MLPESQMTVAPLIIVLAIMSYCCRSNLSPCCLACYGIYKAPPPLRGRPRTASYWPRNCHVYPISTTHEFATSHSISRKLLLRSLNTGRFFMVLRVHVVTAVLQTLCFLSNSSQVGRKIIFSNAIAVWYKWSGIWMHARACDTCNIRDSSKTIQNWVA